MAESAYEPVSFAQPETQRDPFPFIARLLAGPRVYEDPLTGIPIVTRHADICEVLGQPERFSSRNPLVFARTNSPVVEEVHRRMRERGFPHVDTLVTNDPPSHTRYRNIVNRVFTPAIVRGLEDEITAIADGLIDGFIGARNIDLVREYALKLPIYVITNQLGVPNSDWPQIKFWSDISIERISPVIGNERELEITDAVIDMQNYIWARAEDARRNEAQTLLGHLVRAEADGERLNPPELVNVATQIFVAGHETTTALIGHAVYLLFQFPEVRRQLEQDRSLLPQFIEETLRLHPPVGGLRIAAEDTEFAGVKIRKGAMVSLCALSGNYDPAQFPNPAVPDLQRANTRTHLSFGRGIHFCIGNLVARAEARIALDRLLTRLPELRLDTTKPAPDYAQVYHAHALAALHVAW